MLDRNDEENHNAEAIFMIHSVDFYNIAKLWALGNDWNDMIISCS